MRLLKVLVVLILAAVVGLAGYAYLGDMQPDRSEIRQPITGRAALAADADNGTASQ